MPRSKSRRNALTVGKRIRLLDRGNEVVEIVGTLDLNDGDQVLHAYIVGAPRSDLTYRGMYRSAMLNHPAAWEEAQ